MPRVTDEEGKENQPNGSSFSIVTWWRKFHFSGRVIACSVLLGLGLVLIGGLIFAINITDDSQPSDKDNASGLVPTKAPANYTGPVVMGIGGFIVITGVIMCLFETQVCRKKTGDSSPLISERTDDPESKASDPAAGPSTSHGHRSRKPGAHKTSTSPRKSKSRHVKSRSKERNQQNNPSPKTPPVPIHPSKGFITSSDDNFLTPPNTLEENVTVVKKVKSGNNSEAKHSSLMKSFTSSDPSWNQSAEFLTPSTSFRDTSVSLNNSVEIDEHNDEKRLSVTELSEQQNLSSEYMTPLTVEEDRIQQLLIRVKNEQKQMVESKKVVNVGTSEYSRSEKESNPLQAQVEDVKEDNVLGEKIKNEKSSSDMSLPENSSTIKAASQEPSTQMQNASSHELNQNNSEANVPESNLNVVQNEALDGISDEIINVIDEKISSQTDLTSLTNEVKETTLVPESDNEVSHSSAQGNDEQADLDSSVSSGETVVSRDSFQENAINTGTSHENSTLAPLKENSADETKCLSSISESSYNNKNVVETGEDSHSNQSNVPQQDTSESHDLNLSKSEDLDTKAQGAENESKDEAS